jgi:hypothetical protein
MIDLAARWMVSRGSVTAAEARELTRRDGLMALYALRAPVFERSVGPALARIAAALRSWPLLGALGNAVEYLASLQRLHFYTAGSSPSLKLLGPP